MKRRTSRIQREHGALGGEGDERGEGVETAALAPEHDHREGVRYNEAEGDDGILDAFNDAVEEMNPHAPVSSNDGDNTTTERRTETQNNDEGQREDAGTNQERDHARTRTEDGTTDTTVGIASSEVEHALADVLSEPDKAEIRGQKGLQEWSDFSALIGAGALHTPREGRSPYSRRAKERAAKKGRPTKWISRYTCSKRFRDLVASLYPGLAIDEAYWLMMELLLFSKDRRYSDAILLPHRVVARICGYDPHDGRFRSGEFLERFREDVLPGFRWAPWKYGVQVREVRDDGLHPTVLEALALELLRNPHEIPDRVYFASGFTYDAKRDRKRVREQDEIMIELPETDDQRFIQDYLHDVPVRSFAFLEGTFDEAYTAALALEQDEVRLQALKMLRAIYDQPFPFYNPVANSYRLFSIRGGLQQLNRKVRKPLMRGTWDVDADALHLAIMAKAWDIPELQAFLEAQSARALWRSIVEHVAYVLHGLEELTDEEFKAYKSAIKHGVYALGYGGGKAKIAEQIRAYDEDDLFRYVHEDRLVGALISHHLLGLVFEAKERALKLITERGYMEDCYGKEIWMRKEKPGQKGRGPLTVLAMVSSSYEMALMRTVFDAAAAHPGYGTILLYQYDGISYSPRREADAHKMIERMQEAFDRRARELGIATQLSAERL